MEGEENFIYNSPEHFVLFKKRIRSPQKIILHHLFCGAPSFFRGWNNFQRIFDNQITYLAHSVEATQKIFLFSLNAFFYNSQSVFAEKKFSGLQFVKFSSQNFIQKTFLVSVFFLSQEKSIKKFLISKLFFTVTKMIEKVF